MVHGVAASLIYVESGRRTWRTNVDRSFGAALGFLQLRPRACELGILHRWLDSWSGIGHIVVGMER